MKIKDVIAYVDDVKPNAFGMLAKIRMINEVEKMVQLEVLLLAPEELIEYGEGDGDTELLAATHDKIYTDYLIAKIDWHNGEYEKYANTLQMFNDSFSEFKRWFAQVYSPADTHGDYYESEDISDYDW